MATSQAETEQKAGKSKNRKIAVIYVWIIIMIPGVIFFSLGIHDVSENINGYTASSYIVFLVLMMCVGIGIMSISMMHIFSALDKYIPSDDPTDQP
jgi:hypothetical protein